MDQNEFAELLRANMATARNVAGRHVPASEVQDALQNAFLAAWRSRATFDADRGRFRSWLLTIVARESRRLSQQAARRRELARLLSALEITHHDAGSEPGLDLAAALEALTDRQREVVGLHYLADLPITAVATLLQVSEGTIKSTLYDARARLRTAMDSPGDQHD